MFDIDHVSSALARNAPGVIGAPAANARAAVALILAGPADHMNLCMIRRATMQSDVWSGHVALPGGRARPDETTATAVAERETREEVGVGLDPSHRKGSLADLTVRLAGRERGLTLSAVVYFVGEALPPLHAGEEVAQAFWVPLSELWNAANATSLTLHDQGNTMAYPAVRVGTHIIWGVTLRVLTLFSDVIGHPLPHFEEIPGLRV
jgi:8-oxo-dGTP pyrophosphatase MutT (NUDIX family)